jgi:hypothetical protein
MTAHPILQPAIVLVVWSLIVLLWMVQARFGAIGKMGVKVSQGKPGGRGRDLDGVLPDKANWKAHNYAHLMEQPTLFYALIGIIAIAELPSPILLYLAWAYTISRVVHSFWQSLVNTIPVRIFIFTFGSLCLLAMAVLTAWELF